MPISAQDHILQQEDGKKRWIAHVNSLSQSFALCPTHEEAEKIREDVAFFQLIRTAFCKYSDSGKLPEELDWAVRQLVSKAVVSAEALCSEWAQNERSCS